MTCLFSSIQPQCLIRLHNLCHFCQWCFVSHSAWVGSPVQSSVFILPIQDTNVYQPSLQKLLLILNILIKSKKVSLTFSSTQLKKHNILPSLAPRLLQWEVANWVWRVGGQSQRGCHGNTLPGALPVSPNSF